MDVLAYSAFNQQVLLNQQITAKTSCLSTKCSETAAQQAVSAGFSAATVCWVQCSEPCLLRCPNATALWTQIPGLTGASQGFKVCNTTASFNYGKCCQWTVPAGATCARFQIWGAGGGSSIGRCCGGSPFGSSGAYASVIIPVTAASTYTLCAGCANICIPCNANYNNSASGRFPGCPSYVTGTGLNNFCANGGQGRLGTWMAAYGRTNTARLAKYNYSSAGPCFCCLGVHYCFSSSCATCGTIPYVPGASYFGTTTSATSPSIVYGVRGMWPSICFDTNHYGCQVHAPIYGFEASSQCCLNWTSSCCGGGFSAANGYLQIPGAGGFASTNMGGCWNSIRGDFGRMGMVCVTYC